MKYLIYLILSSLLVAETTFITPSEYAAQLYKNPRGIGCQYCHGEKGEGKVVAKYVHKQEKKTYGGGPINKLEWSVFYYALIRSNKGMPRYFLTEKEIQALYLYLDQEEKLTSEKEAPKGKEAKVKKEEHIVQKVEPKKEKPQVKKEEPKVHKAEPINERPKAMRYEDYPDR
ncbi:MAG: hypothetical protein WC656_00910 [Sulfurimonas sp.]|jgi:hypothetical protein